MEIIIFIVFLGIAYAIGSHIEAEHFEVLQKREKELVSLPSVTAKGLYPVDQITDCLLVTGSVVISGDYFKAVLAGLLKFFGGRIVGYEALIDRARRETLLRMKDKAKAWGADAVINTRFEMSKLDSMTRRGGTGMFELLAFGTAIKLRK